MASMIDCCNSTMVTVCKHFTKSAFCPPLSWPISAIDGGQGRRTLQVYRLDSASYVKPSFNTWIFAFCFDGVFLDEEHNAAELFFLMTSDTDLLLSIMRSLTNDWYCSSPIHNVLNIYEMQGHQFCTIVRKWIVTFRTSCAKALWTLFLLVVSSILVICAVFKFSVHSWKILVPLPSIFAELQDLGSSQQLHSPLTSALLLFDCLWAWSRAIIIRWKSRLGLVDHRGAFGKLVLWWNTSAYVWKAAYSYICTVRHLP